MGRNYFYLDIARIDKRSGRLTAYKGQDEFADINEARAKLMDMLPKKGKGYAVSEYIYYGPGVARDILGSISRKGKEYVWTQNDGLSYTLWRNGKAKQILDYGRSKDKY